MRTTINSNKIRLIVSIKRSRTTVPKTKVNVSSMAKGIYIIKVGELSPKVINCSDPIFK